MGRRINERNMGNWSLDGEPKKRGKKEKSLPSMSPEQEKALDLYNTIKNLIRSFKSDYYSYLRFDTKDELIKNFIEQGIVTKGIRKPLVKHAEDIEICHVNPDKISELENSANALSEAFQLQLYIQ
jgi:hypothetical protein